jgi:hypothetical protein
MGNLAEIAVEEQSKNKIAKTQLDSTAARTRSRILFFLLSINGVPNPLLCEEYFSPDVLRRRAQCIAVKNHDHTYSYSSSSSSSSS